MNNEWMKLQNLFTRLYFYQSYLKKTFLHCFWSNLPKHKCVIILIDPCKMVENRYKRNSRWDMIVPYKTRYLIHLVQNPIHRTGIAYIIRVLLNSSLAWFRSCCKTLSVFSRSNCSAITRSFKKRIYMCEQRIAIKNCTNQTLYWIFS